MRILKVWDGEYPWDVRAEKVCQALTGAGHAVHMAARNRDARIPVERLPECTVHRMPSWRGLGRALDAASQFPAFFNPRWVRLLLRVGAAERCEAVLVRDLPLAPTAIFAANLLKVPVVLDMAENYPAMIRDLWTTNSTKFGDALVRNPKAVEAIERWTLARVDHTVVVVEESRDRLVRDLGVAADRITVVGNTPGLDRLASHAERAAPARAATPGPLRLVYLGLLEHARGVGTAFDAVAACRARGVPIRFTVIGDGRARADFTAQCARLGLGEDVVRFLGYVKYQDALQVVAESDAGLIPHLANESWNTTIPNKLFDYMAAGLCVVTSDAIPTKRVVEAEGSGIAYRSGDAAALATALETLWRAQDTHERGQRGRRAIRERYHWELDAERLNAVMAGLR
ncbi:MAG: glycosyltransferase [Gemmatimonadaceae bacterium]|nr:glycosyltransferase [Gemmatimonadaceae bacterium]